jgi:hypothetical protein
MTNQEMHDHVMGICAARDILVNWCKRPSQSHAVHEFEEIWIAPIRSRFSYATALHEVGHILGAHQQSRNLIVRERWAWNWARSNAREWSSAMESYAQSSLDGYQKQINAGRLPRELIPMSEVDQGFAELLRNGWKVRG